MSFNNYFQPISSESHVIARFYDRAVKTGCLTKQGLPEIRLEPFVEIRIQDSNDVVDRPAEPNDFKRFPMEYGLYQQEKKQMSGGTPLTQFAFLDAGQIECCKYRGIFTVEALAELDAEKALSIGLDTEKALAEKFLAAQKNNLMIENFEKKEKEYINEINKLKNEIQVLKESKLNE